MNEIAELEDYGDFTFVPRSYEAWFEVCALAAYDYFVSDFKQKVMNRPGKGNVVVGTLPPTVIPCYYTVDTAEAFRECEQVVESVALALSGLSDIPQEELTIEDEERIDEVVCETAEELYDRDGEFIEGVLLVWDRHRLFYILTEDHEHVIGEIAEEYCYEFVNSPLVKVW